MVAVRTEIYSSKELDQRLERWADWARSPSMGSGGTAEGYMRERLDKGADSAEMTDEIAVTERAVARAKMQEKAFWRVLAKYYLGRMPFVEIAFDFNVSEVSLKALFEDARACVHGHILDIERGIDIDGYFRKNGRV